MATVPAEPVVPAWAGVDWRAHTFDADVRGRQVRYVDIGDGPVVLLVHGLGGSWQTWLENIPALARTYRVVALDLPGFGGSAALEPPARMSEHVAVLDGLLDHLGVATLNLVGHSMGGLISLLYSAVHPQRIERLVLVAAGGIELGKTRLALIVGSFSAFNALFSLRGVPEAFARRPALRRTLLSPAIDDWRTLSPALAGEIIPPMRAPGFGDAVRSAARVANTVRPELITAPVLLIWGRNDRILPVAAARQLAARLRDARLVVLPRTGHCPMFENPPAFNAALQTFLAGDEPAAEPVTLGAAAPTRRQRWRDAYALRKRRRRERRDDRRSVEVDDDHE